MVGTNYWELTKLDFIKSQITVQPKISNFVFQEDSPNKTATVSAVDRLKLFDKNFKENSTRLQRGRTKSSVKKPPAKKSKKIVSSDEESENDEEAVDDLADFLTSSEEEDDSPPSPAKKTKKKPSAQIKAGQLNTNYIRKR